MSHHFATEEEKQKICDVKAKECEELLKAGWKVPIGCCWEMYGLMLKHVEADWSLQAANRLWAGDYSRAIQGRRTTSTGGSRLHPH